MIMYCLLGLGGFGPQKAAVEDLKIWWLEIKYSPKKNPCNLCKLWAVET